MTVSAIYLGANGWILQSEELTIAIDPWIEGDLIFTPGSWLIKGTKTKPNIDTDKIDLIILTQGLADHTHTPSLALFPLDTKVIAPLSSEDTLKNLKFNNIQFLRPRDSTTFKTINIEATKGAKVPKTENGYLITLPKLKIYIEPHGFLDDEIADQDIDVVISPVVNIELPLFGALIRGKEILPELIRKFNPNYILASTTGGNVKFSGLASGLFKQKGTIEEAINIVGSKSKLIDPKVGSKYLIESGSIV